VEVEIQGIKGELEQNARRYLSLARPLGEDPSAARIRRLHERAEQEIREALEPFGYYDVDVEAALERTDGGWLATYRVDEGEPVRVAERRIELRGEGSDSKELREARNAFALAEGDTLDHRAYDSGKQRLLERALENGYLDAKYDTARLIVAPERREARIELVIKTGRRYRFGEVTFEQDILHDRFLQRYVPFETGDPYRSEQLLELRRGLDGSGYFARVDVSADRDRAEGLSVPVRVALEPRDPQSFGVGIGFATDIGPRLSLDYDHRRVNRRGHHFHSKGTLSPVRQSLRSSYEIPLARPATDKLAVTFRTSRNSNDDRRSRNIQTGAAIIRDRGKLRRTMRLNLERERFRIGDDTDRSIVVLPGASVTYSLTDNPVFTRRGVRLGGDIRGTSEAIGSTVDFTRIELNGKFIRGLWPSGRMILRGELGFLQSTNFDDVPLTQRFFTGGDRSVRGFDYQSLSPRNADGDRTGGERLMVGSAEYNHRIVGDWGAAVFFDTGDAFRADNLSLERAAGVGIRWASPLGMVRLDVARTLSEDSPSHRVHVTVGPDF